MCCLKSGINGEIGGVRLCVKDRAVLGLMVELLMSVVEGKICLTYLGIGDGLGVDG